MAITATLLPRSSPESVGLASKNVESFIKGITEKGIELHSLMLLRHGQVVAEGWWHPYRRDDIHVLYSLSKSFCSTAVGFAVSEGLLSLDDTVVSFFPDDLPVEPSANLLAMKVRHLLSMSTGHQVEDNTREGVNWARQFLSWPVVYEPGTHFLYNSMATFMCSAILQKLTGQRLLDYLRPRLLDPIGIEKATWDQNPDGIDFGGWGMRVTTDAIARFGQLYLQDGIWEGRRVIPEGWVGEATRAHISNGTDPKSDWAQGYGFQFWRSRHNCYRGDGAYGQFCVVAPEKQMVVAITSSTDDLQGVLDQVWEHLVFPASDSGLPEDSAAQQALKDRLSKLELPDPKWDESGITPCGTYEGEGASWSWQFDAGGCYVSIREGDKTHSIQAGLGKWVYGSTTLMNDQPQPIAARMGWKAADTVGIRIRYIEEPTAVSLFAKFTGDEVEVTSKRRGRFLPSDGPTFNGRRV